MRTLLLSLFAVASCLRTLAVAPAGDSLRYLTAHDSVLLEIDARQQKYTTHVFAPKQTVYSLGRFYAQDIDQIYALNPELATAPPSIGQEVRVAVPNVAIVRFRGPGFRRLSYAPVYYEVQPGQTAYYIAKTVFRMPVDTLLSVNGLGDHTLSPGQVLQVGWIPVAGAAVSREPVELGPLQKVNFANYQRYRAQDSTAVGPKHRGVASWVPGTGEVSGQLFALYGGVAPGTYLKLVNPANERFAYVKVIGAPTDEEVRRERIDLTVSATAARLLGAGRSNFYVTIE